MSSYEVIEKQLKNPGATLVGFADLSEIPTGRDEFY